MSFPCVLFEHVSYQQAEKLQLTETKLRWIIANDEVLLEDYKIDAWKNGNIVFVQNYYTPRKINPCNAITINNSLNVVANKTVRLVTKLISICFASSLIHLR